MTKRASVFGLMVIAAACGPGPKLIEVPADDPTFESPDASDEGTGEVVKLEEPADAGPFCVEDLCPEEPGDGGATEPEEEEADAGVAVDAGQPADAGESSDAGSSPPTGPVVGSKFVVRAYSAFRSSASASGALLTSVAPHGGVKDSDHGPGQPLGYLPQGQVVVLAAVAPSNGYRKVKYDGKTGWIQASRLSWVDPALKPFDFAVRPANRNAFFKNQLHRTAWNKDGAYFSGTCAPTSLAMAARIFGKEPGGLSIEQSIHRSRQSYGIGTDHVGTNRYQIRQGAQALGLKVAPMDTLLSDAAMLTRIADQLAKKRVVVLEGEPGVVSTTPTAYQQAFNLAYAAAGSSAKYTFDGRHSIAVIGRDGAGYVVGDPISEVGMVVLTGSQLKDFFARWGGTGNAVWAP